MAFSLQLVFSKLFDDHVIFHLRDVLHIPDLEHPVIPSHLFFYFYFRDWFVVSDLRSLSFFNFFWFLVTLHSRQDLSSPIKDQTRDPCHGSSES